MGSASKWVDLPRELLEIIGKHLDSRVDVYRFRAVCTSWRSAVSSTCRQSPSVLLNLPPPILADAFFSIVTICRLELVENGDFPSSSSSSSSSRPASWLTKVEESTRGEMQLLIPLSNRQIKLSSGMISKMLNLLDFRLIELTKAFTLKLATGRPVLGVDKVVIFPNHTQISSSEFGILAIFHEGKLGYWKHGDGNWTLLDNSNFLYDDIIFYKGQYHVVDRFGAVFRVDSSLNLIQFSPPLSISGAKKNLVESCGDLYVVDRYLDGERRIWQGNEGEHIINQERFNSDDLFFNLVRNYPRCGAKTVDFKVYKFDEERGRRWVEVKSLEDRIFVVSNEVSFSISAKEYNGCFSVYAKEYGGWEGNCIYYTDPNDENFGGELSGYDARVFRLKDHSSVKGCCYLGHSQLVQPLCQVRPLLV